jgi:hypothetical protein
MGPTMSSGSARRPSGMRSCSSMKPQLSLFNCPHPLLVYEGTVHQCPLCPQGQLRGPTGCDPAAAQHIKSHHKASPIPSHAPLKQEWEPQPRGPMGCNLAVPQKITTPQLRLSDTRLTGRHCPSGCVSRYQCSAIALPVA